MHSFDHAFSSPPPFLPPLRFNMEIQQDSQLVPNGFIYLKANPETCIQRLRHR